MRKEIVENAGMTYFAEISLIIFVAVFLLFLVRVIFMKKGEVDHMKNLPLEDDAADSTRSSLSSEIPQEAH